MYEYISQDGIHIGVGEDAKDNSKLTMTSNHMYWWMHVADAPGAHVVIYSTDVLPKETLNDAAVIAVYHSRAKIAPKATVHMARVDHVIPGKKTGEVHVIEIVTAKTVFINKEIPRMERLLKTRVHKKVWNTSSGTLSCFGRKSCLST